MGPLRGPAPPGRPIAETIYSKRVIYHCVFNFKFLALVVSEILGVPKSKANYHEDRSLTFTDDNDAAPAFAAGNAVDKTSSSPFANSLLIIISVIAVALA